MFSINYSSSDGIAFVTALWLLAILSVLITSFVITSIFLLRLTDASGKFETEASMARAGISAWMAQARADALEDDADDFTENWGWGGEIKSGVPMGDTVYLPSGSPAPESNDIGFFRIVEIEDESGKQNLKTPVSAKALDTNNNPAARSLSSNQASEVLNRSDSEWLTTQDLRYIPYVSDVDTVKKVYSAFRTDTKINVNTASYESLRGIKMNTDTTTSPNYLDNDLALDIIKRRSGYDASPPNSTSDIQTIETQEKNQYKNGNGNPFTDLDDLCNRSLFNNHSKFNCNVFKQYARVTSEGIFRIKVVGGGLTPSGEIGGTVPFEAYVDRDPSGAGSGKLELIYIRKTN